MRLLKFGIGIFLFFLIFLIQCVPAEDSIDVTVSTQVDYDLRDSLIQQISQWQVDQQWGNIYPYLKHPDATYRYASAKAFTSYSDDIELDSISFLLNDPSVQVRTLAAYSMGQSMEPNVQDQLIQAFRQYDSLAANDLFNAAILEGIGKVGDQSYLTALTTISTYKNSDTILLEGQLLGLYRYLLRDMTVPAGTKINVEYALNQEVPMMVRRIAAGYLYRIKNADLNSWVTPMSEQLRLREDNYLDMGLVVAASKSKNDTILPVILEILQSHPDYRVRCNAVRSLANFPVDRVWEGIVSALTDTNIHVASTAAQFIYDQGGIMGPDAIRSLSRANYPTVVKSLLLSACNKYYGYNYRITRTNISAELRNLILAENNPLRKGRLIKLLVNDVYQTNFVLNELKNATHPGVKTLCLEALQMVLEDPKLTVVYPVNTLGNLTTNILEAFYTEIGGGNGAALEIFINILDNNINDIKSKVDPGQVSQWLSLFDKPSTFSAYNALAEYLGQPIKDNTQRNYATIKWDQLRSNRATINTNKGQIRIAFLSHAAPQTVSRFIQLARDGFYTGKYFHRVVPNFVIQTGCPDGDGYGTLGEYLRTEVPKLHYDQEGLLGMASSGKDTESSQFFITHSPAPHLDGKYTIFAQVTNGMEVVHAIEYGDQIQSISF